MNTTAPLARTARGMIALGLADPRDARSLLATLGVLTAPGSNALTTAAEALARALLPSQRPTAVLATLDAAAQTPDTERGALYTLGVLKRALRTAQLADFASAFGHRIATGTSSTPLPHGLHAFDHVAHLAHPITGRGARSNGLTTEPYGHLETGSFDLARLRNAVMVPLLGHRTRSPAHRWRVVVHPAWSALGSSWYPGRTALAAAFQHHETMDSADCAGTLDMTDQAIARRLDELWETGSFTMPERAMHDGR